MQGWVCAYCLAPLQGSDEVDHFRPKATYWWLAYDFSNYFYACARCNRASVKGGRFPVADEPQRTTWATRSTLDDEPRLLLDPSRDPVDAWLTVDLLDPRSLHPVAVRADVSEASATRAEATIDLLRLNADVHAIRFRQHAYLDAWKLHRQGCIDDLRRRASRFQPHSATIRAFITQMVDDVSCPSADEELDWFLEDIAAQLVLLRRLPHTHRLRREHEEIGFLLATLWEDPPARDAAYIERWLERHDAAWVLDHRDALRA